MKQLFSKYNLTNHLNGFINSYAQLFLADSRLFALLILLASFIDVYIGLFGAFAVIVTNIIAHILNYNQTYISKGYYGFNSLLTGFFIGYTYQPSILLVVFVAFLSLVCFILTIVISGLQANKNLPYLSLPFLFAVWLIQLATPHFGALVSNDRGIFVYNDMVKLGGQSLLNAYRFYNDIHLPHLLEVYLKSLGAIIFQYNIIAGGLLAIGLLIFSRIAFMLSIIGFFSGYFFYSRLNGNLDLLNYTYIGFNFILASIAIGGYFLLANRYSFLLVIIASPIISIIIASSATVFGVFGISVLSLPFNVMVIMVLYFLFYRVHADKIKITQVQLFSPEKNLYRFLNEKERFNDEIYLKIGLPFYGDWFISQGHNGVITHKGAYQYAWDFVIKDDELKTFRLPGTNLEDYYCYSLPIIAPANGYVVDIIDNIDDNLIGDVNLQQNWGNTIIIKHGDALYSKISHVKKNSFKVSINDYVYKGQILASNGSSGRSPEPHLHFQLQSTAVLEATTILYPLSNYVVKDGDKYVYKNSGIPHENDVVANANFILLLKDAFYFIPGKKINWDQESDGVKTRVRWEVFTDINNLSYIYCHNTKALAWFVNDGLRFYFTSFTGNKNSLLYHFYVGAHRVLFSYYQDLVVEDSLPIYDVFKPASRFLNDFILPFTNTLSAKYALHYNDIDDYLFPRNIKLSSEVKLNSLFASENSIKTNLVLAEGNIQSMEVIIKNKTIKATCEII